MPDGKLADIRFATRFEVDRRSEAFDLGTDIGTGICRANTKPSCSPICQIRFLEAMIDPIIKRPRRRGVDGGPAFRNPRRMRRLGQDGRRNRDGGRDAALGRDAGLGRDERVGRDARLGALARHHAEKRDDAKRGHGEPSLLEAI